MQNGARSTKTDLLELIGEFSQVSGYKIHV